MSSCVSPAASCWRAPRRWWAVRLSRAPTQDRLVGARRRMADRVFEAGRRRRLCDNMRAKIGAQKPLRESATSEPRQAGEAGGVLNLGTGDRGCCRGPLQQYVFRSSDVRGAAPWNPGHRWRACTRSYAAARGWKSGTGISPPPRRVPPSANSRTRLARRGVRIRRHGPTAAPRASNAASGARHVAPERLTGGRLFPRQCRG